MIRVDYASYSPILDEWFYDFKTVESMSDFRLFAIAMFGLNWQIIRTYQAPK